MDPVLLVLVAIGYALALFGLAWWADRHELRVARLHRLAYPLALAVYCTSWTFFGAVGSSYTSGWTYLPIYLGPILVYLFGARWLGRLVREASAEAATSISDFISSRFERSRLVAAAITLLMLAGIIPYLALQLRSIGTSYVRVSGGGDVSAVTFASALILAAFAMLFGTRRFDAAGRSDGLLFAVSVESLVKLFAFSALGLFAIWLIAGGSSLPPQATLADVQRHFAPENIGVEFLVITLLSATAIVCLPRQFYMGVIEARSPLDPVQARGPIIAYLALTAAIVLPITAAGMIYAGPAAEGDRLVLDLPAMANAQWLSLLAFIGGFSAATAMVVVETVALATMVSNDLISPMLLRSRRFSGVRNMGAVVLTLRRAIIVSLLAIAVVFALAIPESAQIASIGLVAFAAMVQVAPALLMAVDRREGRAEALVASLFVGGIVWAYCLLLPVLATDWAASMAGHQLDPQRLFGLGTMAPIVHGTVWSLALNLLAYTLVAARRRIKPSFSFTGGGALLDAPVGDREALRMMVARFVGSERATEELGANGRGVRINRATARHAERLLGEVVGGASARALMRAALAGAQLTMADVARLLDQGGRSLRFSRELLSATLDNIDPGVCVVDRELNLVAWNSRYLDFFDYPPELVHVGAPVARLIRHNALRGECGPGEVDDHVERRLAHMRRRSRHSFERTRPNGQVLKTVGGPMPGGGYVMCFTDVTAEAEAREQVEAARRTLENRVAERTRQLSAANLALSQATAAKTRFLAAASHDLLQPLHAARLFADTLGRRVDPQSRELVDGIAGAVRSAEEVLKTLLDISKLDSGGVVPVPEPVDVRALLADLVAHSRPLAEERGISLRLGGIHATVNTDRGLLRSILQNFLSNALRYTRRGGILAGIRPRPDGTVFIGIYDNGPGIAESDISRLFREFERGTQDTEGGIGLGLAIVQRSAQLIGAPLHVRSNPGRGSCFGIILPIMAAQASDPPATAVANPSASAEVGAVHAAVQPVLRLLVVDDDATVRLALSEWARALGHQVDCFGDATAALASGRQWDGALLDFDLGPDMDGLDLGEKLRLVQPGLSIALVTADRRDSVRRRCAMLDMTFIGKPADPDELQQWLATIGEPQIA